MSNNNQELKKLEILKFTHKQLSQLDSISEDGAEYIPGLIEGSDCLKTLQKDGRLTAGQASVAEIPKTLAKKVYTYHVVAFFKFGRNVLEQVPPTKTGNCLTISHICGTRNCIKGSHLLIEPKYINDERTSCHNVMFRILEQSGYEGLTTFMEIGGCNHYPRCAEDFKDEVIVHEEVYHKNYITGEISVTDRTPTKRK